MMGRPPMPGRMRRPPSGLPPGFKLTPEMIEQFKKMPDEKKKKAMQQMPAELRKQLEKAL